MSELAVKLWASILFLIPEKLHSCFSGMFWVIALLQVKDYPFTFDAFGWI